MNKWYDWPSSAPGNRGPNFWCPTASSEGRLRGSLSQRVDLCTEAFCHLLGTFGLGNACHAKGTGKSTKVQKKQDCGQKVMWHNEVMLAFCRAIFLRRVMDKHRLVAQSNLLWVIPILGPGWVASQGLANFWWVETHRASTQHACHCTRISGVSYAGECKFDLPFYLSKCTISLCSPMIIHISHLAVSENAVYLKVVMFIIFFIRKMWTNDNV